MPVRMMVGLLYLWCLYKLSCDQDLERQLESPYTQCSTGEVCFQHELLADALPLTRQRNRLNGGGVEDRLAQTIEAARPVKANCPRGLQVISIHVALYRQIVSHPGYRREREVARVKIIKRVAEPGIMLRQSDARTGPRLNRQAVTSHLV